MNTTADMVHAVYDELNNALQNANHNMQAYIEAKYHLDNAVSRAIADGTIQGKNADERKAAIEVYFAKRIEDMRGLQQDADLARLQVDLAQNNVAKVRALLRIDELMLVTAPEDI
jgi:uncharacterized protein (DUF2225 family)